MADKKKISTISMPTTAEEKEKALQSAIEHIQHTYGKGAIMRLGNDDVMNVSSIPTGSFLLDLALGIGGFPRGRIVELYGPESSGKTTVALHTVAEAQKSGGEVAFIDVEHALDPTYAAAIGVDIESLLVSQPDSGEQALEITEQLIRSGAIDVIVVDSVAALTTKAEIDGNMGDSQVGLLARLMSQAMRKLTAVIAKSNCVAIFINQVREKIGPSAYGPSEVTPGGRALKFYSSVRLDVRRIAAIKDDESIIGARTRVKISKNKVAPPFRECEFDIMYGTGISRSGEIIDAAVDLGIITKNGSWFSYGGTKLGQGRENVKRLLESNKELSKELEDEIVARKDDLMSPKKKKKAADKVTTAAAQAAASATTATSSTTSTSFAATRENDTPDVDNNSSDFEDENFDEFEDPAQKQQ